MKRRYLALLLAMLAIAVAMSLLERTDRRPGGPAPESVRGRDPVVGMAIRVDDRGNLSPSSVRADLGDRIELSIVNAGHSPARVELLGYEDHVPATIVPPGRTWRRGFVADRPGDDFAWIVNGTPAGRLSVAGSHLIEGHR